MIVDLVCSESSVCINIIAVFFSHDELNFVRLILILIKILQAASHGSNYPQFATFNLGREAFGKHDSWILRLVEVRL